MPNNKEIRVFYSWQSDSPGETNLNAIREALKTAAKKVKTAHPGIKGSAREFGETANWRRLQRFDLPGIAGLRIPTLNGRSGAATC